MGGVQVPVPERVYTTGKAVVATVTTGLGVLGLFVADIADGSITQDEGLTLLGAAVTAGATIYGVWRKNNYPKPLV